MSPLVHSCTSSHLKPLTSDDRDDQLQVMDDLRQDDRLERSVRQDCVEAAGLRAGPVRWLLFGGQKTDGVWLVDGG